GNNSLRYLEFRVGAFDFQTSQQNPNRYTPEKAPDPTKNQNTKTPTKKNELPKTGETYQVSWMLVGLLLVGIVVVVYRRQKRK
ncbi:LPXTG cell wall anchor domain-containing protein, partial [Enterococcus faecium]|uniref:LPXTG cell wall anchor domain-containing protein n=2 Tax=Enterococcus TaxID=1350 RepID=UPI00298EECD6